MIRKHSLIALLGAAVLSGCGYRGQPAIGMAAPIVQALATTPTTRTDTAAVTDGLRQNGYRPVSLETAPTPVSNLLTIQGTARDQKGQHQRLQGVWDRTARRFTHLVAIDQPQTGMLGPETDRAIRRELSFHFPVGTVTIIETHIAKGGPVFFALVEVGAQTRFIQGELRDVDPSLSPLHIIRERPLQGPASWPAIADT